MAAPLRVLMVEDSEDDALLLLRELRRGGFKPSAERVETEEAMRAALERQPWDLTIADYALPRFSAPAALAVLRETGRDLPFIVVSGKIGEETAVAMMKAGAHDYIMKDHLARFLPAVQRELREAEVRRERKRLERQILEISDAERRRIGQELHDGLGQDLTGIRFMAGALAQSLAARSAPEAEDAKAITRLLDEAAERARAIARGMCPLELVSGDFVPALQELALRTRDRFQVSCELQCECPVPIVGDAAATHLYCIAQEAVANAVKHGKAKHVEIALGTVGEGTTMAVKDDGVGLPEDVRGLKGLGLRIMKYRADVMGASLDVRRHPNGGTIVLCAIPRSAREQQRGSHTNKSRGEMSPG
jgi:signal transduction histidine kinase